MSDTKEEKKPAYDATKAREIFNELRAHTDLAHLEQVKTEAAIALAQAVLGAATAAGLTCHRLGDAPDGKEYSVKAVDTNVVRIAAHDDGITIADAKVEGLEYRAGTRTWVAKKKGGNPVTIVAELLAKALLRPA